MSRSSEPSERTQHSVAELLARYGEVAPSSGRRRRRAPEDDDSGPRSISERVRTDDVPMPVVDRLPTQSGLGDRGPHAFDSRQAFDTPQAFDSRDWIDADLVGRSWDDRGPKEAYPSSSYLSGADLHEDSWMGLPPVGPGPEPLNGRALSSGPSTDEFPRLDPVPQRPMPERPMPERPVEAPPVEYQPRNAEPVAGLGTATRPVPRQDWGVDNAPAPAPDDIALAGTAALGRAAGYTAPDRSEAPIIEAPSAVKASAAKPSVAAPSVEEPLIEELSAEEPFVDEPGVDEPTSAVREWVMMVTQIGVGVVGGAALWLICEWLWQQIPVVALVVALAVITGLVWVVRHVRRTEDLQTTVIAVLVGLFVTVSPAALLLVGR